LISSNISRNSTPKLVLQHFISSPLARLRSLRSLARRPEITHAAFTISASVPYVIVLKKGAVSARCPVQFRQTATATAPDEKCADLQLILLERSHSSRLFELHWSGNVITGESVKSLFESFALQAEVLIFSLSTSFSRPSKKKSWVSCLISSMRSKVLVAVSPPHFGPTLCGILPLAPNSEVHAASVRSLRKDYQDILPHSSILSQGSIAV
jgi:hypothetical protein